jgi:hypothetical protein
MSTNSPCLLVSPSPCLFCLGGLAASVGIGWPVAQLHSHGFAPVILLPLAAGLALGFALRKLARALRISHRHAVAGALLFALLAIFAEHTWLYRDFRRQWQAERAANAQVAMFRPAEPWSPAKYFQHEASPTRTMLWGLDAALLVAGTVIVVALNRKKFVVPDDANRPLTSDL